jgi:hypothetical protein
VTEDPTFRILPHAVIFATLVVAYFTSRFRKER